MPDKAKGAEASTAFERVVDYFLGHEKPKDEPEKKPAKPRNKASTKPKRRGS